MRFLERRRRALQRYILEMPALLSRDYGAARAFSPAQVQKTLERYRLDQRFAADAIAIFSSSSQVFVPDRTTAE